MKKNSCKILNEELNEELPQYDAIFNGTIYQQKLIINIILKKSMINIKEMKKKTRNPQVQVNYLLSNHYITIVKVQ